MKPEGKEDGLPERFLEKKVLDHILKVAAYIPPATIYLGLSTADPLDTGAGVAEPTYTGYARKAITFGAAASRAITQNAVVTFDACTSGSSIVHSLGIVGCARRGGNRACLGRDAAAKTIVAGNTPSFASGQISVSFNAGAVFSTIANTILDWLFRGQAFAQPTHVKIAISTTIPTDGGPNITEPSGNNYGQVTQDTWNATTLGTGATSNNGDGVHGSPSGSWGTAVYGVIYLDANPFVYFDVIDQAIGAGDTVKYLSGQVGVSLN